VARTQWQITLRNCTSHETSALALVKVLKDDKTGRRPACSDAVDLDELV
jgi:hypothetical protein